MGSTHSASYDEVNVAIEAMKGHLDSTLPSLPKSGNKSTWLVLAHAYNKKVDRGLDGETDKRDEVRYKIMCHDGVAQFTEESSYTMDNLDICRHFTPNWAGYYIWNTICCGNLKERGVISAYHLLTTRDLLQYAQSKLPRGYTLQIEKTKTSAELVVVK